MGACQDTQLCVWSVAGSVLKMAGLSGHFLLTSDPREGKGPNPSHTGDFHPSCRQPNRPLPAFFLEHATVPEAQAPLRLARSPEPPPSSQLVALLSHARTFLFLMFWSQSHSPLARSRPHDQPFPGCNDPPKPTTGTRALRCHHPRPVGPPTLGSGLCTRGCQQARRSPGRTAQCAPPQACVCRVTAI